MLLFRGRCGWSVPACRLRLYSDRVDNPSHAMERLKGHGNGYAVWRLTHMDGTESTLKSWPLLFKSLLTLPVGMAQAQRQARGTRRLLAIDVPTPVVVSGPRCIGLTVQLELQWIDGCTALDMLRDGDIDVSVLRAAAVQLGGIISRIATGGFMHRDLKLSNIIIERGEDGLQPWLIDTVGVRRCMSTSGAVYRMLERVQAEIRNEPELVGPLRMAVVRAAFRSLPRSTRRAVCRRLRSHRSR